jgi:hypothetical protein
MKMGVCHLLVVTGIVLPLIIALVGAFPTGEIQRSGISAIKVHGESIRQRSGMQMIPRTATREDEIRLKRVAARKALENRYLYGGDVLGGLGLNRTFSVSVVQVPSSELVQVTN